MAVCDIRRTQGGAMEDAARRHAGGPSTVDASLEALAREARDWDSAGDGVEVDVPAVTTAGPRRLTPRLVSLERTQNQMVASSLDQDTLLSESFRTSRFLGMLLLHATLPFSIPFGIYALGLRAAKLCEIVPTSFPMFLNTNGLVLAQYACLALVIADPNLRAPVLLAFLGTGAVLWLFRQIMIGGA